jgi:hypothetical protein
MYFVVSASEDGISVQQMDKEDLLLALEEDGLGEIVTEIPDADPNYWGVKSIIIKGALVAPRAVEVVKKLEID